MSEGNEADRAAFARARDAEKAAWTAANPSAYNPSGPGATSAGTPNPGAGPANPAETNTGPSPTWNAADFLAYTGKPLSGDPAANSTLIADTKAKNDAHFLTYTGEAPTGDYDQDRATWQQTTAKIEAERAQWSKDFEEYNGRPPTDDPEENARITAATVARNKETRAKYEVALAKYRQEYKQFTGEESTGNVEEDQKVITRIVAADAAEAEVDRVPDSRNAGLQVRFRRYYREIMGKDPSGSTTEDVAQLNETLAANSRELGGEDRLGGFGFGTQKGPLENPLSRRNRNVLSRDLESLEQADDRFDTDYTVNPDPVGTKAADDAAAIYDPLPLPTKEVRVAPNTNRPLSLLASDAQAVQRAGPGHPGFQDAGSTTQAITASELQRLADSGGTLAINGEEVDVAALVRDNVAYGDGQNRGRGSRQRGQTYQRDLNTLAAHLTSGLTTGGVSRFHRPGLEPRQNLTLDDLRTAKSFSIDGVQYNDPQQFIRSNLSVSAESQAGKYQNPELASRASALEQVQIDEFMAKVNEARATGRFGLGDEQTYPYFDPNTKGGFNPLELLPGVGFVQSVRRSGQPSSPGGALTTPTEQNRQLLESGFTAAEVVTWPVSGPVLAGGKRLVSTLKGPLAQVDSLSKFRRQTADLVADGLDPATARQVAAANQGQTVADMARLEKGLTAPKADPYAGLSTGQQTLDDTARAVQNRLEIERKLTGNRDTPETIARRLQNQQHGTTQKTAAELEREISQKSYSNKMAYQRGQEIPYPEVDRALYVKSLNDRAEAARATSTTPAPPPGSAPSYTQQLRSLDTSTRKYKESWRLPDAPGDGPSPTGWNPDKTGPEFGSQGNFWSVRAKPPERGGVATLERPVQQTVLSADERAALLKNTLGRDEFADIPEVAPPKMADVVQPRGRGAARTQPDEAVDADVQVSRLNQAADSPGAAPTFRRGQTRVVDEVTPATAAQKVAATSLTGAVPAAGVAEDLRLGTETDTEGTTAEEREEATQAGSQAQPVPADATLTQVGPRTAGRVDPLNRAVTGVDPATQAATGVDPATQAGTARATQVKIPGRLGEGIFARSQPVVRLRQPQTMAPVKPAPEAVPTIKSLPEPAVAPEEQVVTRIEGGGIPGLGKATSPPPKEPTVPPLDPFQPSTKAAKIPKPPPPVQLKGRARVQENEVVLPAGEEHPHVVEHETKAIIRTDLRTGEQRVTPIDYRNVETLEVVKRGKESTDGRQVESGALTLTNHRGKVHAVSDPALTGKGGNTVVPRFQYTPPPPKPAKRRRGGGKRKNGSAGEDKANRGPTQISVEFGG